MKRSARLAEVEAVLADLESLLADGTTSRYAVEENIAFFEAQRSRIRFVSWLLGRRKRLEQSKMLEIADLDLPRWQEQLYRDLVAIARRPFPGLVKPLVGELSRLIRELAETQVSIHLASIGCGPMEVERQLIEAARHAGLEERVSILGIDSSSTAFDCAAENLSSSGVHLQRLSEQSELATVPSGVYFLESNASNVVTNEEQPLFDVLYHARFIHHIPVGDRETLEQALQKSARVYVEYDDYQCMPSLVGPLFTAWRHPVLLNGAIISWTRDRARRDLSDAYGDAVRFFNPPGTYLRMVDQRQPA
jgi:hypothetical protein